MTPKTKTPSTLTSLNSKIGATADDRLTELAADSMRSRRVTLEILIDAQWSKLAAANKDLDAIPENAAIRFEKAVTTHMINMRDGGLDIRGRGSELLHPINSKISYTSLAKLVHLADAAKRSRRIVLEVLIDESWKANDK